MSQSLSSLRIGSRASPLAVRQAQIVGAQLQALYPHLRIEYVSLRTTGDILTAPRLSAVGGKGLFTKELQEGLFNNQIDIAIHSLKDMATRLPEGLTIGAILKRDDPRDAFIAREDMHFGKLSSQIVVGTSSLRREAFTRYWHPDIKIIPLRGNIQTRLQKLKDHEMDCTFLALAGIQRMDLADQVTEILEPEQMLPAVAQGCLAVECRTQDEHILELLKPLHHESTGFAVLAERAFLRALDGSCRTPIAAFATVEGTQLHLRGALIRPDGQELIQESISGSVSDYITLGTTIATCIQTNLGERLGRDFKIGAAV